MSGAGVGGAQGPGALLIGGTASDTGKSAIVAGLCRVLARRGVSVAPFKAQNMSNNSVVTPDGGEIGRAQFLQAEAAGIEPSVTLNPVLLKPGSDRRSQLVLRGKAIGEVSARGYHEYRSELSSEVLSALNELRDRFDVVVCEGAGSVAEINLRGTDLANMGLAQQAGLPTVLVGDIDRGGVLAHLAGSVAVLGASDQSLIAGFIVNKFRGDRALLEPGLEMLTEMTGRPVLGVIPYLHELWIDAEDSLGTIAGQIVGRPRPPVGERGLRVAAIRLPRISNSTDVEALATEPGVTVVWADHPAELSNVDLVVIPGSKSTLSDLSWLQDQGLAEAIAVHIRANGAVLGICGGFQMLCQKITDTVEAKRSAPVDGLGHLAVDIEFASSKTVSRVEGVDSATGQLIAVDGYEIHHGQVARSEETPMLQLADGRAEGAHQGLIWGTHWHGLLASDEYRRRFLSLVAQGIGARGFILAPDTSVTRERAAQLDLLADAVEENCDVPALLRLIESGAPCGLPELGIVR